MAKRLNAELREEHPITRVRHTLGLNHKQMASVMGLPLRTYEDVVYCRTSRYPAAYLNAAKYVAIRLGRPVDMTENEKLHWKNGVKAHKAGKKLTDNPHERQTKDHHSWEMGWLFAQQMACYESAMA